MKINILTLFPEMINNIAKESILGKAIEAGHIEINAVNIRDFTDNKWGKVDDYTYGGGAGMLIQAQPVYDCFKATVGENKSRCIYVTPQGHTFNQTMAQELANEQELTIICGHYEGIDERVLEEVVTDFVSIGDYVLTGGELAAMIITDAVARLVPEVLGNEESAQIESFHRNLLEYPQYTRPEVWHDKAVPKELLNGDPKVINAWRYEAALKRTKERRYDLYEKHMLEQEVLDWLKTFKRDYVYMSEPLKRGLAKVLYYEPEKILVLRDSLNMNSYVIGPDDMDLSILDRFNLEEDMISLSSLVLTERIKEHFNMQVIDDYRSYVYTAGIKKNVSKAHDIRLVEDEASRKYVIEKYGETEYYCNYVLDHKCVFGYYVEGQIVGFVGQHPMGAAGILYVDEDYRRQGIAKVLEQFILNYNLEAGYVPYALVLQDNEASIMLQKAMELYPGSMAYTVYKEFE